MFVLGAIALGAAVAGTGLQAFSQHEQGREAKRAAERNAQLARMAAADAVRRGAAEAGRARAAGSQIISRQRAVLGASGVDLSSGAPAELAQATAALAEMDAEAIRNNAFREAWGLRTGATEMVRQGKAAETAGNRAALGTILGGAAQAGMGAYKLGGG